MNNIFFDEQASLGFMTITANRLLNALLRRKMRQAGINLTAEQWGILVLIWNRGSISQEEASRIECMDASSMSRVLAGMERKGLIFRKDDPADARRKIIHASDKAWEIQGRSQEVAQKVLDSALKKVSPQDRAVCLNVLAVVKQTLTEDGE